MAWTINRKASQCLLLAILWLTTITTGRVKSALTARKSDLARRIIDIRPGNQVVIDKASLFHPKATEVHPVDQEHLNKIPLDVIARHVFDPSRTALTRKDYASFLATSKHYRTTKQVMSNAQQFYYFTSKHFGLRWDDHALRVRQAFYRCGRLSLDAAVDLILLKNLNAKGTSEAQLIALCASEMMEAVRAGIFPNIQEIPVEYQIGLVYQTNEIPGTYELLVNLFDFKSLTVRQSLVYERFCVDMAVSFTEGSDVPSQLIRPFYERQPVLTAGCLLWLTERSKVMRNSLGYVNYTVPHPLLDEYHHQVAEYRHFVESFGPTWPHDSIIRDFVARELLLSLVPALRYQPFDMVEDSFIFANQLHPSRIKDVAEYGVNVNTIFQARANSVRPSAMILMPYQAVFNDYFDMHMRQYDLGIDVNGITVNGKSWLESLLQMRHAIDPKQFLDEMIMFTRNGVDITQFHYDDPSQAPLMLLKEAHHLPALRQFVEVNLNRVAPDGDPLIFKLFAVVPDLSVVQYLVEQGMKLTLPDYIPATPLQAADSLGLTQISDWLRSLPDHK